MNKVNFFGGIFLVVLTFSCANEKSEELGTKLEDHTKSLEIAKKKAEKSVDNMEREYFGCPARE